MKIDYYTCDWERCTHAAMTKDERTEVQLFSGRDISQGEDNFEYLHLCPEHTRKLLTHLTETDVFSHSYQQRLIGAIRRGTFAVLSDDGK